MESMEHARTQKKYSDDRESYHWRNNWVPPKMNPRTGERRPDTTELMIKGFESIKEEELWRSLNIIGDRNEILHVFDERMNDFAIGISFNRDPKNLQSTGTAFVRFRDEECVETAFKQWNWFELTDGRGRIQTLNLIWSDAEMWIPRKWSYRSARPASEWRVSREMKEVDSEETEERMNVQLLIKRRLRMMRRELPIAAQKKMRRMAKWTGATQAD